MSERGSIIPNGVVLKEHEMATVVLLTELGCNVELIPKSNLQGVRTPDVRIEGLLWEIKSPKGEGKSLMKNTVQKACRQSCNVIVDLRRVKRYQEKCLSELNREFEYSRSLKRLKIITKNGSIIDLVKN
ncbi:MAG: hypothetical protein K6F49_02865 [Saccharofermentans sp.]|nr:hypothetical protein [Saccharofermentans sp.]